MFMMVHVSDECWPGKIKVREAKKCQVLSLFLTTESVTESETLT
jgi:hypothetical protein